MHELVGMPVWQSVITPGMPPSQTGAVSWDVLNVTVGSELPGALLAHKLPFEAEFFR